MGINYTFSTGIITLEHFSCQTTNTWMNLSPWNENYFHFLFGWLVKHPILYIKKNYTYHFPLLARNVIFPETDWSPVLGNSPSFSVSGSGSLCQFITQWQCTTTRSWVMLLSLVIGQMTTPCKGWNSTRPHKSWYSFSIFFSILDS